MDITSLDIECRETGSCITVWVKCRTAEDVEVIIAWLQQAKSVMNQWSDLRERECDRAETALESLNEARDEIERLRAILKKTADAYQDTEYYVPEILAEARRTLGEET